MKCIIYIRTSSKDQYPEKQLLECKNFANNKGYNIINIKTEKLSAYKNNIIRPEYEIIKEMANKGEIKAIIVWALDRWVRNRDTLLEDVTYLRSCGVKLHSVKEDWLETINIDGGLGKTIQDFLLGLMGSLAEMESQRKSERVKMAYNSYKKENRKYKKWGRKNLPLSVIDKVKEYYNSGKSLRWISKNVNYYDKNKNLKNISLGSVHKIITQK